MYVTLSLSLSLPLRILQRLPTENQQVLHYLLPLLHRITEEQHTNDMNSINLAICFAPTLLWPDSGLDVIKNEVPPLIQFMIEHSPEIFGHELPDLYRVESVLSPSPRSYRVPTKKNDGNVHSFGHRRNQSFDTSTSEDSAGEDDLPSNLIPMQRSGLTASDSQVSVLSQQLEDEEYTTGAAPNQGGILVMLSGEHHAQRDRFSHSPKRHKKSRPPERSSSYRGPNERPPYVQKYHVKVDDASRRKSIATQTTLQHGTQLIYPSPSPSPSSSQPISPSTGGTGPAHQEQAVSSFIKSRQMQSFDENEEFEEEDLLEDIGRRASQKRKRGGPAYRPAYSVDSSSMSFYDHLPPLGSGEGGLGISAERHPRKLNLLASHSFDMQMDEEEDAQWDQPSITPASSVGGTPLHPAHPILSPATNLQTPTTPHASNQSITSRESESSGSHYYNPTTGSNPKLSQSRPSTMSLVSESSFTSTSTVNKEDSPEPERTPLSREMVKNEITRRFHIPSRGNSFNSTHSGAAAAATVSGGGTTANRSDSFNQEMDNIQRRFQERRRPEARTSVSTASSTTPHSEVEVLSSPPSFDDRPESEQHLHSLPRRCSTEPEFIHSPPPPPPSSAQPAAPVQVPSGPFRRARSSAATERRRGSEPNPIRLSVENNNSDTESSPSRTLTRKERQGEAQARGGSSAIPRYLGSVVLRQQPRSIGHAILRVPGRGGNYQPQTVNEISIIPAKEEDETGRNVASLASAKNALTQSLPPPAPQAARVVTDTTANEAAPVIRPKSAEGGRRGATAIDILEEEEEEEEEERVPMRKRTMSDVEKAKLRLGLIPPPSLRRSKSISEAKPTASLAGQELEREEGAEGGLSQGNLGENERGKAVWDKADKAEKRGIWRAHAPSSTDRKEAYTQRMRAGGSVRANTAGQGGTGKVGVSGHAPPPPIHRTATAPEMGSKRRATTMPEYLVTRSSGVVRRGRVLGQGLVRTVKITSYHMPEVQKIHRINLRTFH